MDFAELGASLVVTAFGVIGLTLCTNRICRRTEWSSFLVGITLLALVISLPLFIRSVSDMTAQNVATSVYAATAANMLVPWFILLSGKCLLRRGFHILEVAALCIGPSTVSIIALFSYISIKEAIWFDLLLVLCILVPHCLNNVKWRFETPEMDRSATLHLSLFIIMAVLAIFGSDMFIEVVFDYFGNEGMDQVELAQRVGASAAFLECGMIIVAYLLGEKESASGIALGCVILNMVLAVISVYCLPYELF